jgi:putative membrane protein insertion efficiency factor
MNPVGLALRGVIRAYQLLVSPILPSACRFMPSCSAYAMEAVTRHGPLGGSWLAAKRVCRCHPWHEGGYDPVPEPRSSSPSPSSEPTAG